MAWRLNNVLAYLHPNAIPSEHRQRPNRRGKEVVLMQQPLPVAVLAALADLRCDLEPQGGVYQVHEPYDARNLDKHVRRGVDDVIGDVLASGCIPDAKSHQS